jgi:FdhE protein
VSWDERIARARWLAAQQPSSSDILLFYAALAEFQRSMATAADPKTTADLKVRPTSTADPSADLKVRPTFGDAIDLDEVCRALPAFLAWLQRHAPPPLAKMKRQSVQWRNLVRRRVLDGDAGLETEDAATAFVVEALLQPFAESAAVEWDVGQTRRRCPRCGSPPVAAVLREEGNGARRSLCCPLCLAEWPYLRVHCPACEENRFEALPVYTADAPAHVRVDACDRCRTYVKTVDLTKDGLAVPVVDDLATVALDLWARDRGYQRVYPNLLRL